MSNKISDVLKKLKSLSNPRNVEGMARFGINPNKTLGVSMPLIRKMAKTIGKDHTLAQSLWNSEIHEARILAGLIDDPKRVTEKQMEKWANDFDSWDVCDQACMNLFDKTEFAHAKAVEWATRKEEFVKRAGFALMASLAVHDKESPDRSFERFFPAIKNGAPDNRNFVRKAVNWALRQAGKRNIALNRKAILIAEELMKTDSKSAKWVAADALKELKSPAVQRRLKKRIFASSP